jgi:hypothetical protein
MNLFLPMKIVLTSKRDKFVGPQLRLCDGSWHALELTGAREKLHIRLDEFSRTISVSSQVDIQQMTLGALSKGSLEQRVNSCLKLRLRINFIRYKNLYQFLRYIFQL